MSIALDPRSPIAGTATSSGYLLRLARCSRACAAVLQTMVAASLSATTAHAGAPTACDISDVVSHALPSVVNISVVRVLSKTDTDSGRPTNQRFEPFVGSGAVVDPSGLIITNKHVIQDAAIIRVTFQSHKQVPAQLVAAANAIDLAVLKVAMPEPLPILSFGNSDALQIGQPAIAVGNPLGIGTSVSAGVISGVNRDLTRTPFDDYVQTDASINPGNSGGPLLDCSGHIIGINTALVSNSKTLGSIGLGFALPSNDVRFVVGALRDHDHASPDWIGLHAQDVSALLAEAFGLPDTDGAIVTGVDPDSPASRASLERGDVIIGIDDQHPRDSREVQRTIVRRKPGDPIRLAIWREGEVIDLTVKGEPWPHMVALRGEVLASPENVARAEAVGLGLYVATIVEADRTHYGIGNTNGVLIVQVIPGSQADNLGLQAGDVIQQIGRQQATSVDQVNSLLMIRDTTSTGHLVPMLVQGKAGPRWVPLWVGRIDPKDLVADLSPIGSGEAHEATSKPR